MRGAVGITMIIIIIIIMTFPSPKSSNKKLDSQSPAAEVLDSREDCSCGAGERARRSLLSLRVRREEGSPRAYCG